jgi:hypothetical protein
MKFMIALILLFSPLATWGADEDTPAYWEFGAGVGGVHYEHYPAANEFSDLILPFPTFQYRGKILRADDREGAHAYLVKGKAWTLEIAGAGFPALDSSQNEARKGMDNLPWLIALGPQLVTTFNDEWQLSFGLFQATSTDFEMTRFSGQIAEGRLSYRWNFPLTGWKQIEDGESYGRFFWTLKGGSEELQSIYFDVPRAKATSFRPEHQARAGFLSQELAYFQSFKSGRAALYVGGTLTDYSHSANRLSPLHRSDLNVTMAIGMTYVLGESSRPGIPEEDTSGVIDNWRKRRGELDAL